MTATIETEVMPTQALAVREMGGAVSYALSLSELHQNLEYVRQVMRQEMKKGEDYGVIPGTGDKPTLLQPGAQKLMLTFNLTEKVKKEVLREYPGMHREHEFTISVCASNGKEWDGVGTCSTLEVKYRYRKQERQCPKCGKHTILQSKDGPGFFCWKKKGGCGANFAGNDKAIVSQKVGRIEHDNPADYWNTVRKMAFKRALVHATINATNTSDLWTQDLDDMRSDNDDAGSDAAANGPTPSTTARTASPDTGKVQSTSPPQQNASGGNLDVKSPMQATAKTLEWALEHLHARPGEPARDIVSEFFTKVGALLRDESGAGEQLEDLPLEYVPTTKAELADLVKAIAAFEAGEEAKMPYKHPLQWKNTPEGPKPIEEAEPAINPDWEIAEGLIEHVSLKEGTSAKGPWSLWGIKLGGEWHNTFSNRIGKAAQEAHKAKREVTLYFSKSDEGKLTAEEIE